ncbi:two-component sensor histidine kinase [Lachnospiraceae bacterium KM106-2]|nr:two-component sensor histidine kinase [Lachnospiraceae bacterium KM106-2]
MQRIRFFHDLSIQVKLILAFMLTSAIIIFVNVVMYYNINLSVAKVNEVYESNLNLNHFTVSLGKVGVSVKDYLETKSSQSIDNYYRSVQEVESAMEGMNTRIIDSEALLMQKNIYHLTNHYLQIAQDAIQAKRGRNIEKYRTDYKEAKSEASVINTMVYSLNNELFKTNSKNYEALMKTLKYLETICVTLLIVVVIANFLLIYLLTKRITTPLIRLAKSANEIGAGNFNIPFIDVTSLDEVGIVSKAFNQMILSIQQYIQKVREGIEKENAHKEKELMMESHLKDARLKYLQAQINPHFLFNTLNAGAQLAMMEGADQTCTFIENMADFFRYNIKKINEDTTLEEELTLVDHYIYILNVRFSGEIHYDKRIDQQFLKVRVPSMILQPIVENAVNHGIRNIERSGKIVVSVFQKEMHLCISVKDNGVGMNQEQIDTILQMEEVKAKSDSNGIGMNNVIKRLNMYFHGENLIEIKSEGEDQGTEVILYLPILE